MKTRILILIGIIFATSIIIILALTNYENPNQQIMCSVEFILQGESCVLNPKFIDPNTVVIYDMMDKNGAHLSVAPHAVIINLQKDNTVTWINKASHNATVSDDERGLLNLGYLKQGTQKSIQLNSTGFYSYLVVADSRGTMGTIVVLGDDVDSLSVRERAKMAQAIISDNFREHPELIGVGSGGAPGTGISITINEKELELHEDAKSYYYEKYSKMIPFDVPIVIKFGKPIFFAGQ